MQYSQSLRAAVAVPLLFFSVASAWAAGSATWNLNPTNGSWFTAANWTPANVPNTIADTATFGVSNITTLTTVPGGFTTSLGSFVFNPGASAYTVNFDNNLYSVAKLGQGVQNDSGVLQTFSVPPSSEFRDINELNNTISFIDNATAGILTQWTVKGSSRGAYRPAEVIFNDDCTAASAVFVVSPGGSDIGGEDGDGFGGILDFRNSSTADHCTIAVTGGAAGADYGSPPETYFTDDATAANAIITTTGGTIPLGDGGDPAVIVGSIEGDGVVSLGSRMLSVGSNNLSTTFSGVIQDSELFGGLTKIGSGTLTLTGSNTYTAGTTVTDGTLRIESQVGSGTGTGPVTVASGTLGGNGTIGGTTTIGDGRRPRALLEPAAGTKTPSKLTIESPVQLENDATYIYHFKARNQKSVSDEVVANGVTIGQNATFTLAGSTSGALAQGLILTVFDNTAATPIAGTFGNLPDGGIITFNGNNFQANYEGGDGNDLTLTAP